MFEQYLDMGAKFTFTPPQELTQESMVVDVVLEETQPADEQEIEQDMLV